MKGDDKQIPVTRVWLIRHGEPTAESKGRCYGRLDVGLSEQGRQQMESVSRALAQEPLKAIYVSPRKRTMESAAIIAKRHCCPVRVETALREIDFGDLEGRSYDEIAQVYPEVYRRWMEHPTETLFPNGESFALMKMRVLMVAHGLYELHRGETIGIVSHGGGNRILLAEALGIPSANVFRIGQRHAALNLLRFLGDYPSVELMNLKCY